MGHQMQILMMILIICHIIRSESYYMKILRDMGFFLSIIQSMNLMMKKQIQLMKLE